MSLSLLLILGLKGSFKSLSHGAEPFEALYTGCVKANVHKCTLIQKFGVEIFGFEVTLVSPMLHLFDRKYSKKKTGIL